MAVERMSFNVQYVAWEKVSRPAAACAAAGVGTLTYLYTTRSEPYPPLTWSRTARAFPDHIALGLGPFSYSCTERGAVTPVDRVPIVYSKIVRSVEEMKCRKPGSDVGSTGLVMVDESSYDLMKDELKDVVRALSRKDWGKVDVKRTVEKVPVRIVMRRNITNRAFNSYASFEEKRAVERDIVAACAKRLKGKYHGLSGSKSQDAVGGMGKYLQDALRVRGLLFEAPWTVYDLSCGFGRHWPDARGVFIVAPDAVDGKTEIVVWVNHEDHLEVVGVRDDGDFIAAMKSVQKVVEDLETSLGVAKSDVFGYMSARPEEAGISTLVSSTVQLSDLALHPLFSRVCGALRVQASLVDKESRMYDLSSCERFGLTNEEAVRRTEAAVRLLVEADAIAKSDPNRANKLMQDIVSNT